MLILVNLIGLLIIGIGGASVVKPQVILRIAAFWKEGTNLNYAAVIRILVGLILSYSASSAEHPNILLTIGDIMILAPLKP